MVVYIKKKSTLQGTNISHLEKRKIMFEHTLGERICDRSQESKLDNMDVSKNMGKPPKWMVKIMENPMNKWMIWRGFYTPIFGSTPLSNPQSFVPIEISMLKSSSVFTLT